MKKWGIAGEEAHGNLEDLIEVDFTLTHINIHTDLIRKKALSSILAATWCCLPKPLVIISQIKLHP